MEVDQWDQRDIVVTALQGLGKKKISSLEDILMHELKCWHSASFHCSQETLSNTWNLRMFTVIFVSVISVLSTKNKISNDNRYELKVSGTTSITVQCFVVKKVFSKSGQIERILECEAVFVAVDEEGRPRPHGFKL